MDWLLAGPTLKDRTSTSDSSARDVRLPNSRAVSSSAGPGYLPCPGCSFLGLGSSLSLCSCKFRDSLSEKGAAPSGRRFCLIPSADVREGTMVLLCGEEPGDQRG